MPSLETCGCAARSVPVAMARKPRRPRPRPPYRLASRRAAKACSSSRSVASSSRSPSVGTTVRPSACRCTSTAPTAIETLDTMKVRNTAHPWALVVGCVRTSCARAAPAPPLCAPASVIIACSVRRHRARAEGALAEGSGAGGGGGGVGGRTTTPTRAIRAAPPQRSTTYAVGPVPDVDPSKLKQMCTPAEAPRPLVAASAPRRAAVSSTVRLPAVARACARG